MPRPDSPQTAAFASVENYPYLAASLIR